MSKRTTIFTACGVMAVLLVVIGWNSQSSLENLKKKSKDLQNIRAVASRVGDFADPLPGAFHWRAGLSLPFSDSLTVENTGEFMILTLVSEPLNTTGFAPLDESLSAGTNMGKQFLANKWTKKSEGITTVAGHSLKFDVGDVALRGHHVGEFRGTVNLRHKTIYIDAYGVWDKPFNMELLQQFLKSIKSLNEAAPETS